MLELQPVIDISNYTQPFTASQLMWIRNGRVGVIIGLQDASKARDFKAQLGNIAPIDYYIDKLGRNLTIPTPGSRVWADVEPGCIYDEADLRIAVRHALPEAGLDPGWYGNLTSIRPVIGDSTEFADLPFWYANYGGVPIFDNFVPFNGIVRPEVWQYSDVGIAKQYTGGPYDLNCDLNFREVDVITRRLKSIGRMPELRRTSLRAERWRKRVSPSGIPNSPAMSSGCAPSLP